MVLEGREEEKAGHEVQVERPMGLGPGPWGDPSMTDEYEDEYEDPREREVTLEDVQRPPEWVMSLFLTLRVPIHPVAKGRPRFDGRSGRAYTPSKTRKHEQDIRDRAIREMGIMAPAEGPLELRVTFILKRQTTKIWKKKAMPSYWSETRPDLENYLKAALDGMDGVVMKDDGQVARIVAEKRHAAGDEMPGIRIEVWEIKVDPDHFPR